MTDAMTSPGMISARTMASGTPLPGGIVVAIDGSPESIAALDAAAVIAKRRNCPGHVVSVLPQFPSYQITPGLEARMEDVDDVRFQLRETAVQDLLKAGGMGTGWSSDVVMGQTAHAIVSVAQERGADLIVIGRRAHGMLDRILGGETTLQVIRLSPVPVLAVSLDQEGPLSIAAVAVDFSPSSARAAQVALEMLGGSGTLYLVHVEPPVELFPNGFTIPGDVLDPDSIMTWFNNLVLSLHAPEGVTVEPVVLNGKAVPTIIEFAERVGAGMIAAGSHGHAQMEHFLLGGVSTGLVRNARCAVLISPSGD